jgi:peptide/nickel transport system ATP-binding protein
VTEIARARLEVSGLSVALAASDALVVDDVSFSVYPGDVLALVGESGSGKTTVSLALLGYARQGVKFVGGRVVLSGEDVLAMSPQRLRDVRGRRVAYVPQDPASALNPALQIGTQLREVLRTHGRRDPSLPPESKRLEEMLAEVKLTASVLRSYPHQLSGGQQQRVALAMAFACRPELIVLDEPTTGLDVSVQRRVLDTIRDLCRAYMVAAVYVTHDLAVVAELADHVAVMYVGRVIELGTAGDVFGSPAHPYTRGLLRAIPSAAERRPLKGIGGQPPRPEALPPGCSFAPRCPVALPECTSAQPAALLASEGHTARCILVGTVSPARPTDHAAPAVSATKGRVGSGARASGSEDAILRLAGIRAHYGESAEVLHGIDLNVASHTCVGVVGESGSGKTTLARCVAGLHTRWSGEIALRGERLSHEVRGRTPNQLRSIQYIFQNPYASLNPRRRIVQLVDQPLGEFTTLPSSERMDRVVTALEDAALGSEFLARYPHQLSGGERQRVAIARALVSDPEVLICDEITSALDVSVQAAIVELLMNIQQTRGMSLIFITHNLALVRNIAQEVSVMRNGEVVESGSTEDLFTRPKHEYTVSLLADTPGSEDQQLAEADRTGG